MKHATDNGRTKESTTRPSFPFRKSKIQATPIMHDDCIQMHKATPRHKNTSCPGTRPSWVSAIFQPCTASSLFEAVPTRDSKYYCRVTDLLAVSRSSIPDRSRVSRHQSDISTSASVVRRRKHCCKGLRSSTKACSQLSAALSESEFEFCRQNLITIVQHCNDLQFFYFSTLLSSVLHCFRPLHRSEIVRIFHLICPRGDCNQDDSGASQTMFERLLAICEHILLLDSQGFVHFSRPAMKDFLLSYSIKSIERSHFTMARACIAQITAEQKRNSAQTAQSTAQRCFSVYAAQNWHRHYQRVQTLSPGLTGQARQILQTQISRRLDPTDDPIHRRGAALEHARRFCVETGLQVLLEEYLQLLAEHKSNSFPQYPLRQKGDLVEDVAVVSEALRRMTTESQEEEEWVLVA